MNTIESRKAVMSHVQAGIKERLGNSAYTAHKEIIEALAYACTFHTPRRFSTIEMTGERWQDLASTLTIAELANVQNALHRFVPGKNRLFFILACYARIYGNRKTCPTYHANFQERHYTRAELASCITKIEDFNDEDL